MNKQEQKEYNSFHYKTNERYSIPPEQTVYFPVWNKIREILTDKETIMEIGCGSGQLANLLLRNGKKYISGIDMAEEGIKLAQKMNPTNKNKFKVGDVDSLDWIGGVDTLISTEVLEHIENDIEVVDKIAAGTRFIFSVPNFKAKGHLRTFQTLEEIKERYKNLTIINHYPFQINSKAVIHLIDSIV